jgi:hypothetical protein
MTDQKQAETIADDMPSLELELSSSLPPVGRLNWTTRPQKPQHILWPHTDLTNLALIPVTESGLN